MIRADYRRFFRGCGVTRPCNLATQQAQPGAFMNLIELGENTDCEFDNEHQCAENQYPACDRLVHCIAAQDQPQDQWQLHNIHFADEDEVAMGEAEMVGEVTYHSMIQVNFCPFCGTRLAA
jgi:hypothetical protein